MAIRNTDTPAKTIRAQIQNLDYGAQIGLYFDAVSEGKVLGRINVWSCNVPILLKRYGVKTLKELEGCYCRVFFTGERYALSSYGDTN